MSSDSHQWVRALDIMKRVFAVYTVKANVEVLWSYLAVGLAVIIYQIIYSPSPPDLVIQAV